MSTPKQYFQSAKNLFQSVHRLGRSIVRGVMNWLLRVLVRLGGHPSRLTQGGFVLPTVVMVMLVVILLTTAIVFRSFDRAKNASNFRVNQAVLNAATPALDRATAKIEQMFTDPLLPRGTPADDAIESVFDQAKYTFTDETQLTVTDGGTNQLGTAWRFPVDTDGNGLFDSFTLYGIYYRSPATEDGKPQQTRSSLEARTPPMDDSATRPACDALGTSATLVGTNGWYRVGSKLKKSFFAYVATVPITDINELNLPPGQFENYRGNQGFSALEYQRDIEKIPQKNNAILYEGDVQMAAGSGFRVNGRIFTNGNLLIKEIPGSKTELFQVSSRNSCFYEVENSKIVVGGNYGYGTIVDTKNPTNSPIDIHLFQGTKDGNDPEIGETLTTKNTSVTPAAADIAYNSEAYERRIDQLVEKTIDDVNTSFSVSGTPGNQNNPAKVSSADPDEVKERTENLINNPANPLEDEKDQEQARRDALEIYFRNRTRRVAYAEVPYGTTENIASVSPVKDAGDNSLRPPNDWMFPYDPSDGKKAGGFSELPLNQSGDGLLPEATAFEIQEEAERENFVGDRLLIGNNLPALWYDEESQDFVSEEPQEIEGTKWDQGEGTRARKSRVNALDNLDTIARDGFWENAAAEIPEKLLDGVGGLRIVTGAGVYLPYDDDISTTASPVVWPDTMPMILPPYVDAATVGAPSWLPGGTWPTDLNGDDRPYLKMRATAVYHYTNHKQGEKPKPIACVATYYDPTNRNTARNPQMPPIGAPVMDLSNEFVGTKPIDTRPLKSSSGDYIDGGNSFNGITFKPPSEDATGTMLTHLRYQAGLVYPNGRPVNQLLADALDKANEDDRTLAEQAAIDATICGLQIYGKVSDQGTWGDIGTPTPTPTSGYKIPHGTIKETAFLDARQVKLIDKLNDGNPNDNFDNFDFETEPLFNLLTSRYDLPIEQRYPLEVRATVIDLQELVNAGRTPSLFGTSNDEREYMFPNSGIIYATRDDALPDASNDSKPGADDGSANVSRTDFKLDPTRRPSGIMLINGSKLGRRDTFAEVEKGLTLASNLPVYVKGEFNPHKKAGTDTIIGEFEGQQPDNNTPANTFYSRDNLEEQFACRKGDERLTLCTQGDDWRAASIISDAVTLLSHNFREGVRVEGDYDLRNNQLDNIAKTLEATKGDTTDLLETESIQQKRLHNGFWNNDFAINGLSSGVWIPQGSIVKEDSEEDSEDSILPDFPNAATGDVELTDAVYSRTDPNADDKAVNSSYFNNMVTPVQRRGEFPEYVMEYCPHILVSDCGPGDWIINDNNGLKASNFDDFSGNDKKANTLRKVTNGVELDAVPGTAGTTATGAAPGLERYPRRVAFKRDGNNKLELRLPGEKLIPLGIDDKGNNDPSDDIIQEFPLPQLPARQSNALWFATNQNNIDELNFGYNHPLLVGLDVDNDGNLDQVVDEQGNPEPLTGSTGQPLLRPVLQLQYPTGVTAPFLRQDQLGNPGRDDRNFVKHARFTHWLPRATDLSTTETPGSVIFNAAFATGDTPSRPPHTNNVITPLEHLGDFNGGVLNLVRLLENWDWSPQGSGDPSITTQISGSLMQIKNSAYATGSYAHLPENKDTAEDGGPFNYPQMYSAQNTEGRVPFFEPSARNWGYDVGLLSQFPDLFAQQFTLPSTDEPNQFYREVSRNDPWVQRLLCGQNGNGDFAINETQRPDCS